jgi:hypothetical protein
MTLRTYMNYLEIPQVTLRYTFVAKSKDNTGQKTENSLKWST